jgi:hypothetical protein
MFCSNCGEKFNITTTSYKTERIQNVVIPKIDYTTLKQQSQPQWGRPGKYSKLSLGLALASIIIGIVTLLIGYNFYRLFYWPYTNLIGRIVLMIVILLLRVGGLIMGILSRVNSSKAEVIEPHNDVEKAGGILAILGIVINAIGLFLSLIGPFSIFSLPMMYPMM